MAPSSLVSLLVSILPTRNHSYKTQAIKVIISLIKLDCQGYCWCKFDFYTVSINRNNRKPCFAFNALSVSVTLI